MRILIGPTEVSGIAGGLKAGFDQLGVEARLALSMLHPFEYEASQPTDAVVRIWMKLGKLQDRSAVGLPRLLRLLPWAAWKAWALIVWAWALLRFDAYIFLFSNTLTNTRAEARLYAYLGKKVIMVYCGSDARPPYVDGPTCAWLGPARMDRIARLAGKIRARIRLHEQCGFICVNAPVAAQFHAQSFVNWFELGIPRAWQSNAAALSRDGRPSRGKVTRVLHSPSNPQIKGTQLILDIVERLKREGYAIELVLLQGVSNERVQAELEQCDFVIDQCWSDSPMGAFAVEAAHHGKPAIVGGYAASEEYRGYLSAHPPPTLFVHPDKLEEAVRQFVVDHEMRAEFGRRALHFVRNHWSPESVARRYLKLFEGCAPPEQFIDPDSLSYVHGCGLPEGQARANIQALISKRGFHALQLLHNPALQDAFVDFASARPGTENRK